MITAFKGAFPIDWTGTYENIFEAHGGRVLLCGMLGVITEQFDANTSLNFDGPFSVPTMPAASVVGSLFGASSGSANGTHVIPFVPIENRYVWGDDETLRMNPDRIASTGKIEITIWYEQLDPGAYVTAA